MSSSIVISSRSGSRPTSTWATCSSSTALTVHKSIPNLTENQIRLSVDYRYQPPSLPIEKKSITPHCEVLPWEEIYAGWKSKELQYYWQNYDLDFREHDASLVAIQEA